MVGKICEYRLSASDDGSEPMLVNQHGEVMSGVKSILVDWKHNGVTCVTVQLLINNDGQSWPTGIPSGRG